MYIRIQYKNGIITQHIQASRDTNEVHYNTCHVSIYVSGYNTRMVSLHNIYKQAKIQMKYIITYVSIYVSGYNTRMVSLHNICKQAELQMK